MKLSEELMWRGFMAETTVKDPTNLDNRASKQFYLGADPSADSLTIGNLAALMMCACFVRHGYKPYLLVGGATGQIGDPKDTAERELKPLEEIEHNKKCIKKQMESVIGGRGVTQTGGTPDEARSDSEHAAGARGLRQDPELVMVDNYDWFKDMGYLEFLRTIGKAFSMTQLMDRKFIQSRMGEGGSGISYAEFSYTLIQGYDFLHLFRTYGIDLQLCGADQYGNASSGITLIRKFEGHEADVWSTPLVIDPVSGRKFGKSEGNAVWLASSDNGQGNFTSVFDFYQFWLNQPDESVEYLMKIYTTYEREQVEKILAEHKVEPAQRVAQKALAFGVTSVVHGGEAANRVAELTAKLFGKDEVFTLAELETAAENFPVVRQGLAVVDALVETGLASSKKEAKTFLKSGAISAIQPSESGSVVSKLTEAETIIDRPTLLKRGKNKFAVVR